MPSSSIMVRDDESIPPEVAVAASRRWWLIGGGALAVAAIWIVASGGAFGRLQTPAVPEGARTSLAETGRAETAPTQAAPPTAPSSARSGRVVEQEMCSDGAGVRLELTNIGGVTGLFSSILVRFELHRSPVGHEWRILIERLSGMNPPSVWKRGTRVASDSGDLMVRRMRFRGGWRPSFRAKALDMQTGEVCTVSATASLRE